MIQRWFLNKPLTDILPFGIGSFEGNRCKNRTSSKYSARAEGIDQMALEQQIDSLIEAGWLVLNNDFGEVAFEQWRNEALKCLTSLCGPDHSYTAYFKNRVFEEELRTIPVGVGVLEAAKAQHL